MSIFTRRNFLKTTAAIGATAALPLSLRGEQFLPGSAAGVEDSWLQDAVDAAMRRGAVYAEILQRKERRENIQLRKEDVHNLSDGYESGMTLRVFKAGAWGAAAISASAPGKPGALAEEACRAADAMARIVQGEFDVDARVSSGSYDWETPVEIDPFEVPVSEKVAFLRALTSKALGITQIPFAVANLFAQRTDSTLLTSRGAVIRQRRTITYPNFAVTAFNQRLRRMDNRSSSLEAVAAGWELSKRNFTSDLETAMQEVLRTQTADPVVAGTYTLIVHPSVLWDILFDTLLPHLDARRVLGTDGSRPGDPWITTADIGHKRIGSPLLQLSADGALPMGLASSGWDDSSRPAQRTRLVEDGVIRRLPTDDTIGGLPADARCAFTRSAHWSDVPGPAMPNVVMQEGSDGNLADLIAGVDTGLFIKGRGTIVTNPQRTLFRVKPQAAWMIRGGKIDTMVRDVEVETSVEQFWNALSAVGSGKDTLTAGDLFPSRAHPLWSAPFSVSVPPTRFADIPVYTAQEQR